MPLDLAPQWSAPTTPFRHTWEAVGNVDQFRWFVRADLQEQLAQARDELGLRHVRAVAMYSPEMRVWEYALPDWRRKPGDKAKRANWQVVDYCLERLVGLGLKPIYTTCFMPADFTDRAGACWPDRNRTGMPRDLGQWQAFVAEGIRHHIARFGADEVRSWYFECWNEPNLGGFFDGSREEFFQLWSATWRAVKSVDPGLRFGGPSTARGEWLEEFLDHAQRDGTPPDYLISHVYNNDSESQPLSPFDGAASDRVKDSPHFASGVIRGVRRMLDARGWRGEVHWNEWGRSWFPHDPVKETPVEGAFYAKTMAEVGQEADAFAFWALSDIYDQAGYQGSEFEAHYGMCSLHGLRKPTWQVHRLLSRLGTARVPVEGVSPLEGAVATVDGGPRVLVYRYPSSVDAAAVPGSVRVRLPPGARLPRLFRVDRVDNNIISAWRAMGAPAYPDRRQLADLHAANGLVSSPGAVPVEDGWARFDLECPGVALLEL